MHILILHGNGGTRTRFIPMLSILQEQQPDIKAHIPLMQGFDGRPMRKDGDNWEGFLADMEQALPKGAEEAVLYGHGIGGSLLMELAAREFTFPNGRKLRPQKVILHSVIGASLHKRFFPKLMKPLWVRNSIKSLITASWMQGIWEKRLFQHPDQIPQSLRNQFFADYAQCEAFSVFFDLITVDWYRRTRDVISQYPFLFLWGGKERVVSAKYLELWRKDFPQAHFDVIQDWDHFPMLDNPEDFTRKFVNLLPA